jgi:[ribosomal protein S18]-alanine N-acetyltransferase
MNPIHPHPAPHPGHEWRAMTMADLDAVMQTEQRCYEFPWTRGNFADALASNYFSQLLENQSGELLAYLIAMPGVGEMHLLNITVDTSHQHQGHAHWMMNALQAECIHRQLNDLFLEVRPSNLRARVIYAKAGFIEVGLRKNYYPAANHQREDALVLRCVVSVSGLTQNAPSVVEIG